MNIILLRLISLIHILLLLFVVGIPFINSNYFLLIHFIIVPFIILHWVCNENTCFLTLVEKYLRLKVYGYVDPNDCLTCRLIEPVYDFKKNYKQFTIFIYVVTIILWIITTCRLYRKYQNGEIKNWIDLFII